MSTREFVFVPPDESGQPAGRCGGECPVDLRRLRAEHSMKPDGTCGHDHLSIRIAELDQPEYRSGQLRGIGRIASLTSTTVPELHRRAFHCPERAEDTAIPGLRSKQSVTAGAFVEEHAGVRRHRLRRGCTATWARERRFEERLGDSARRGSWAPHSITRSARSSSDWGSVTPICLAVFRLITSSNFVGRSTGRSAGFAPFRIFATYPPALRASSWKLGP